MSTPSPERELSLAAAMMLLNARNAGSTTLGRSHTELPADLRYSHVGRHPVPVGPETAFAELVACGYVIGTIDCWKVNES